MFRRSFLIMACLVALFCAFAVAGRRRAVRTGPRSVRVNLIPEGAEIIYHRDQLIYAMRGDGQNPIQITFEDPRARQHAEVDSVVFAGLLRGCCGVTAGLLRGGPTCLPPHSNPAATLQ